MGMITPVERCSIAPSGRLQTGTRPYAPSKRVSPKLVDAKKGEPVGSPF